MMDALGPPPGISWSWNDRIQEQGEQMALVYVLMSSLFESLTQPFAILFAIPFSLVGATWLLFATGTPFNLMANMGVLILMGIVVNSGISCWTGSTTTGPRGWTGRKRPCARVATGYARS